MILFSFDPNIANSGLYPEYMSIYKNFPNPPGVEYFHSRNTQIDLKSPWQLETTDYVIPPMPTDQLSFDQIADEFGYRICKEMDSDKQVYMMWSGGIDSTSVAVSLLRNIKNNQYKNLHVVSSALSRQENPMFYHNFLSKFDQIELFEFNPGLLDINNTLILDGEGGDQIFGSGGANKIFSLHPDKILQPWRKNIDFVKCNLQVEGEMKKFWPDQIWTQNIDHSFFDFFLDFMTKTIEKKSAQVETLYDFFWWINFNFKFDSVMWRHTLRLSENISDQEFEFFSKKVLCRMFAQDKMQQWSMSAGADKKIHKAKKTIKWAARNYIYNFDHNEYYFREKRKEYSSENIPTTSAKYLAVDKNYQRYTIADRSTRLSLRKTFYPDSSDKIQIPPSRLWV
jgi:hypothetical protein